MHSFINKYIYNSENSSGHNNNFNTIRFFAAIMVIIGHMYPIIGSPSLLMLNEPISTLGVKIFFLLSGYLITESYIRDSNIIRYFLRRFFRIIPGLTFLIILTVFIFGPILTSVSLSQYFTHNLTFNYLKNICLYIQYALPGVFEKNIYPNAVNGSLWSLPAEVLMYILVPIVIYITKYFKKREIFVIVLIIILFGLNALVYIYNPNGYYVIYATNIYDVLRLAPYFFIGSLFTSKRIKIFLNLQLSAFMLFISMTLNLSYIKNEILLYIVLSYFIFSFALTPKPIFKNLFTKNDYSYGIYLYGFLVQQTLVSILSKYNLTYNMYVILSIIFSFILSFISWHIVEKPSQILCKKLLNLFKS